MYWNLFNVEGESTIDAAFATYATLNDMLKDINRTGTFVADGSVLFGTNIVGTGSDGTTYWNLFNVEGESIIDAAFATYATLNDMLKDINRTSTFVADGSILFGVNIVGTGAEMVRNNAGFRARHPSHSCPQPSWSCSLARPKPTIGVRQPQPLLSTGVGSQPGQNDKGLHDANP